MSLSKIKTCANCRLDEDQVEIRACSRCGIVPICSDFCENALENKHAKHCRTLASLGDHDPDKNEFILEVALLYDDYQALERAVKDIEHIYRPGGLPSIFRQFCDIPDLICFHIELGDFVLVNLRTLI